MILPGLPPLPALQAVPVVMDSGLAGEGWRQWFQGADRLLRLLTPIFGGEESTQATAIGVTLSTDELLSGVLLRSGPVGAFSDTTPDADDIVAAIPKAALDTSRLVMIRNGGGGLMTLLAGANVTLAGTTTIAAGSARWYLIVIDDPTIGSENVTVRGLMTGVA